MTIVQQFSNLLAPGTGFTEDNFSGTQGGGWFPDDPSMLHLLCNLFLLLLHQLHLRSSSTGSWRLGIHAVSTQFIDCLVGLTARSSSLLM